MIEGDFIITPQEQIKIGRLCRDDNNVPAVAIKRAKRNEYETVPIAYLITELSKAKEDMETEYN